MSWLALSFPLQLWGSNACTDLSFPIHGNESMLLSTDTDPLDVFPIHFAQGGLDCRKASLEPSAKNINTRSECRLFWPRSNIICDLDGHLQDSLIKIILFCKVSSRDTSMSTETKYQCSMCTSIQRDGCCSARPGTFVLITSYL